jgi:hypothetical protein
MDNSSSLSSSAASQSSKMTNTHNKNKTAVEDVIAINEKVNLTKQQHQVLKIICDTYQISLSEYMQQALIEAMRFDIEEGNLCDALLEKIGVEDSKRDNSPPFTTPFGPNLMNSDLDLLKKLQT